MSKLTASLVTASVYAAAVVGSISSWVAAALLLGERLLRAETALLLSWAATAGLFVLGVVGVALIWRRARASVALRVVAVLSYAAAAAGTTAVIAFFMMVSFNT